MQSSHSQQYQQTSQQQRQSSTSSSHEFDTRQRPQINVSHAYSRSSPAAPNYDAPNTYHPYTPTTPGATASHYASPSETSKYGTIGSQRHVSNTPLGLADIRPRADSSMSDGPHGNFGSEVSNAQPGPSNYIAPWAIYAFDWCKWPAQGNGAGKVAVGSYLEDGHNFVSFRITNRVHSNIFLRRSYLSPSVFFSSCSYQH